MGWICESFEQLCFSLCYQDRNPGIEAYVLSVADIIAVERHTNWDSVGACQGREPYRVETKAVTLPDALFVYQLDVFALYNSGPGVLITLH